MNKKNKIIAALIAIVTTMFQPDACIAAGIRFEALNFGNFNSWITRTLHESAVIGGHSKTLYEIGPTATIDGNKAYKNMGGSPWATSNVYAHVAGITKGSNAVFPAERPGNGKCAKLTSHLESVKVLGVVNMDVMVAGSIFLGRMLEPVTSTKNPYSKMEMGIPYTKSPKALVFDYMVDMPTTDTRLKSTGFGRKKTLPGRDNAVVFVMLQRRWEDADGHIHAKRVASGSEKFRSSTKWHNAHAVNLIYGDPTGNAAYDASTLALRSGDRAYYARNSKGKMVPVEEEGWDTPTATPTHAIVMISAGDGAPYVGTPGLTFYVDNVGFGF